MLTAQLLEPSGAWYRLSPLVAEYARKSGEDGSETAVVRLLAHVRVHAVAADFEDNAERLRAYVVPPGKHRWTLPEPHIDWLDEHRALALELARIAFHSGQYKEVCQLAGAFEVLVNTRGRWSWFAELSELYVEAARRSHEERGNPRLLARALMMRAKTRYLARHFAAARPDLDEARAILAGITERGGRDRQVAASLLQFDGRYHEEYAEAAHAMVFDPDDAWKNEEQRDETIGREIAEAARCLREAVRIDLELGDDRATGIDRRMLASMAIKGGVRWGSLGSVGQCFRTGEEGQEPPQRTPGPDGLHSTVPRSGRCRQSQGRAGFHWCGGRRQPVHLGMARTRSQGARSRGQEEGSAQGVGQPDDRCVPLRAPSRQRVSQRAWTVALTERSPTRTCSIVDSSPSCSRMYASEANTSASTSVRSTVIR